jgi:hypothetical protein
MKKYFGGFIAITIAITLNAFTKPDKNNLANFYLFSYNASFGYSQSAVENESNWGCGTLVTSCKSFTGSCDLFDDKACEIIVAETCTVLVNGCRKLSSSVSITSCQGSEIGKYYVCGGSCICGWENRD